jgi:hypothetical protein
MTIKHRVLEGSRCGQVHLIQRKDGQFSVEHWFNGDRESREVTSDYSIALSRYYNWEVSP